MAGPRSPEGKAAKKFAESLDCMGFDANVFAYLFVDLNPMMQARAMEVVKALIMAWADQYDRIGACEEYNVDAKRFRDTMDRFSMTGLEVF